MICSVILLVEIFSHIVSTVHGEGAPCSRWELVKSYCVSASPARGGKSRFVWPLLGSDSVSLGWGLKICTSSKFPGDACAAGPRVHSLRTTVRVHALVQAFPFLKPILRWGAEERGSRQGSYNLFHAVHSKEKRNKIVSLKVQSSWFAHKFLQSIST